MLFTLVVNQMLELHFVFFTTTGLILTKITQNF